MVSCKECKKYEDCKFFNRAEHRVYFTQIGIKPGYSPTKEDAVNLRVFVASFLFKMCGVVELEQ